MSNVRVGERVHPERSLDWVVALLGAALVSAAYVDAWARVQIPASTPYALSRLAPWEELGVSVAWFVITSFLLFVLLRNLARGLSWRRALPDGYQLALLGCLLLGVGEIASYYWSIAFGFGNGLPALLSPLHLLEILAGGLIVSGPLRAAIRRREEAVGVPVVLSASLTLSTLTFLTQFAHPLSDVWSARGDFEPQLVWWVAQDIGAIAILVQATTLLTVMLLLVCRFRLPAGSLTLLCVINGALLVGLKAHYPLLTVMLVTGLVADLLLWRLGSNENRKSLLQAMAATVPAVYTASYAVVVAIVYGTWWPFQLWVGLILVASMAGYLVCYLLSYSPGFRRTAPAVDASAQLRADWDQRWPRHHVVEVAPDNVKHALEALGDLTALANSPLTRLACISGEGSEAVQELRTLLTDVVGELATSQVSRDAEAGKLLVDYYIRHVGSHETIAERLHLSRPTFYRRLQHGLTLVAKRIHELSEFAASQA